MSSRAFHIQTFGCQMNASDSHWLVRSLNARGFVETAFDKADIYILNTCSVRDKPEHKVYSELGRIARRCKVLGRKDVTVCVGGCVAQQVGASLLKRFPQVRLVFGADGIAQAPRAIERLVEEPHLRLSLLDFTGAYEERAHAWEGSRAPASAFVSIMQGCDNYCTYCIVPYVRGRQKSRDARQILEECRVLIGKGTREITLLGQNVNSYGQDLPGRELDFSALLEQVGRIPGLERLRFMTPHPKDISPRVIAAFGESSVLCPRLHLPLQSGSDAVLKKMGRHYDVARYLSIVRDLKKARPDILLTTDIIVGFPGETEDDFAATMGVMGEVGFSASFSFIYSDRPHARAALLPGKVERRVALDRLSRLQSWQNQASDQVLESMVGTEQVILLENPSRHANLLQGTEPESDSFVGEAPDAPLSQIPVEMTGSDGRWESWQGKTPHGHIVNVALPVRAPGAAGQGGWEGALMPVRIHAAARHSLKGSQAGEPW